MTFQDLRYVVALAETKHFARAAEACHVSQPTLSTQVKKLEDELGVQLFERTNKRVMLTPIGRDVIAQARLVLEEADTLRQLAQQGRDPMVGPLRLGVIPTLGPYLLPHIVPPLRAAYPELRLYLREGLTAQLLDQLHMGTLDALLLALPVDLESLEVVTLFSEPFVLALPAGHPLTRKQQVRESDLQGAHVLLLDDGHCLRDQALAVCGFPSPSGAEDFRASSLETLRQMVAAGVGCTLLPQLTVSTSAPQAPLIELRPFAAPVPYRVIGLVWRQSFPRGDVIRGLAELIWDHVPPGVTIMADRGWKRKRQSTPKAKKNVVEV